MKAILFFLLLGFLFGKIGMPVKEAVIPFIVLFFILKGMFAVTKIRKPPY